MVSGNHPSGVVQEDAENVGDNWLESIQLFAFFQFPGRRRISPRAQTERFRQIGNNDIAVYRGIFEGLVHDIALRYILRSH